MESNPLVQNSVQQNFFSELYPLYPVSYQKYFPFFSLASCPHHVWTAMPLPPNLWRKLCRWGENPSRRKNACLPHQKKFSSPNSNFHVITQYKVHLQLQSLLLYHFFNFRFYVQIYQANSDYSMVTESYLQHDKSIGWSKFLQTKFPTPSPLFYLSMLFGKPCLNYCLFSSLLHPFLISNFCFHSSWDCIAYELITLHKK